METYREYINNSRAPFNNVKVRQAMAYAINKKEIVDTALFGAGGIVATGAVIPPGNYFAVSGRALLPLRMRSTQ